ncbi:hypothetical protein BDZ85DRAFT_9787 [Elsinoe ampelina]|uniref:Uncharacterized protein n=1 Tax=Elsinoe ampelina TaxID=302913 RepID=A0A6A6GRH0_9PEZI|nr:hypothetical protein BDZ85DRAFT_9787 [Elsinoe ampelina]
MGKRDKEDRWCRKKKWFFDWVFLNLTYVATDATLLPRVDYCLPRITTSPCASKPVLWPGRRKRMLLLFYCTWPLPDSEESCLRTDGATFPSGEKTMLEMRWRQESELRPRTRRVSQKPFSPFLSLCSRKGRMTNKKSQMLAFVRRSSVRLSQCQ